MSTVSPEFLAKDGPATPTRKSRPKSSSTGRASSRRLYSTEEELERVQALIRFYSRKEDGLNIEAKRPHDRSRPVVTSPNGRLLPLCRCDPSSLAEKNMVQKVARSLSVSLPTVARHVTGEMQWPDGWRDILVEPLRAKKLLQEKRMAEVAEEKAKKSRKRRVDKSISNLSAVSVASSFGDQSARALESSPQSYYTRSMEPSPQSTKARSMRVVVKEPDYFDLPETRLEAVLDRLDAEETAAAAAIRSSVVKPEAKWETQVWKYILSIRGAVHTAQRAVALERVIGDVADESTRGPRCPEVGGEDESERHMRESVKDQSSLSTASVSRIHVGSDDGSSGGGGGSGGGSGGGGGGDVDGDIALLATVNPVSGSSGVIPDDAAKAHSAGSAVGNINDGDSGSGSGSGSGRATKAIDDIAIGREHDAADADRDRNGESGRNENIEEGNEGHEETDNEKGRVDGVQGGGRENMVPGATYSHATDSLVSPGLGGSPTVCESSEERIDRLYLESVLSRTRNSSQFESVKDLSPTEVRRRAKEISQRKWGNDADVEEHPGPGHYKPRPPLASSLSGHVDFEKSGVVRFKSSATLPPGPGAYIVGSRYDSAVTAPQRRTFGTAPRTSYFTEVSKGKETLGPATYTLPAHTPARAGAAALRLTAKQTTLFDREEDFGWGQSFPTNENVWQDTPDKYQFKLSERMPQRDCRTVSPGPAYYDATGAEAYLHVDPRKSPSTFGVSKRVLKGFGDNKQATSPNLGPGCYPTKSSLATSSQGFSLTKRQLLNTTMATMRYLERIEKEKKSDEKNLRRIAEEGGEMRPTRMCDPDV